MQEQNFEKQVQQKMDELSFAPSEPVWQKVEKEIRKKKERRRAIFWLFPFLLFAGISVWWLASNPLQQESSVTTPSSHQTNTTQSITNTSKQNGQKENKKVIIEEDKKTASESYRSIQKNTLKKEAAVPVKPEKIKATFSLSAKKIDLAHKQTIKGFKKVEAKTENEISGEERKDQTLINEHQASDSSATPSEITTNENEKELQDTSVLLPVLSEEIKPNDSLSVVTANDKKWRWSAYLNAGASGISTAAFKFSKPSSSQYLYEAAPLQNNAGSFSSPPASKINKDFSFAAGFAVERKLFKKVSLSAGLRYNYYSTWSYVGQKVGNDTTIMRNADFMAVSNFYRNSNTLQKYKNQYHFMELPIGLAYSFLKNNHLKLESGFSVAYLLQTNAVYYNQQAGIYYQDKNVFNKTALSLYAQLTYKVASIKNASLHIGPQASFTATNLLNKNTTDKQHLFFTGLTTKVSF